MDHVDPEGDGVVAALELANNAVDQDLARGGGVGGRGSPDAMAMRVLLPAPFSPTSPRISPGLIRRSTARLASISPKRLLICRSSRANVAAAVRSPSPGLDAVGISGMSRGPTTFTFGQDPSGLMSNLPSMAWLAMSVILFAVALGTLAIGARLNALSLKPYV
jgi:hypothetical protein